MYSSIMKMPVWWTVSSERVHIARRRKRPTIMARYISHVAWDTKEPVVMLIKVVSITILALPNILTPLAIKSGNIWLGCRAKCVQVGVNQGKPWLWGGPKTIPVGNSGNSIS